MSAKATPPTQMEPEELEAEAVQNWQRAVTHRDFLRREWEADGCPTTETNPNGIEYEAPLHKMLRYAELDVAARLKDIPRPAGKPGRKQLGVPASISESPASRRRRARASGLTAVEGGKK